ncbi:winged helix DNA-binding domain-containing protein [Streptomonospora halophila]|uniref:Winged helix DNA-binding domain-containing protein n=1 Tax=Streptomonospora halophila TaxID=427369 RepID=A0ABP9GTD7_9ACTN
MSEPAVLGRRSLNRATLERQLLLRRSAMPPEQALSHLVGLQAQTPHTWYTGLWARLADYAPEPTSELLGSGAIVRIPVMRSTIHLLTADDAVRLRPLMEPVHERMFRSAFGRRVAGLDAAEVEKAARAVLQEGPLTFSELGARLAAHGRSAGWGERDPQALAQWGRTLVPLVQVPPRGQWGRSGQAAHAPAEAWLGRPLPEPFSLEHLVLRYLAAFGPASVLDVQKWCGLTRLGEVVDELRPRLRVFRSEDGRELFDLPDAPRPDAETPAPVRFLYDFDNLRWSYADLDRLVTVDLREHGFTAANGLDPGLVLLDGFAAGGWRINVRRRTAVLHVRPFRRLSGADEAAMRAEAEALLEFYAPAAAERAVEVGPPSG